MGTNEIRELLKSAIADLNTAENELKRPNEDVVALSACMCTRQSMKGIMKLYLLAHSLKGSEDLSLKELMVQCIRVDKQFATIDLSRINCKDMSPPVCDEKYCLSLENVSHCIEAANQLKALVLEKLKIDKSEMDTQR